MNYERLSMEDAGTRTGDFIMRLRWKPSKLRRWFGAQEETVAYYGQDAKWHAMDGLPASSRVRKVLEYVWDQNQPIAGVGHASSESALGATPQIQFACVDLVDVASEGSFPASDPPAWTLGR